MSFRSEAAGVNGIPLISSPDEISAEWMLKVLRADGVDRASAIDVLEVEKLAGATNAMGSLFRCRLSGRDISIPNPASVIVKLPGAEDMAFRLFSKWFAMHRREYVFFRHIAPGAGVRAPSLFYADFDERSHRSVLVMEDLGSRMETVPQQLGVGPARALAAIRAIARLQGEFNRDTAGAGARDHCREYLNARERRIMQAVYMLAVPIALDRFGELFSPSMRRLAVDFGSRIDSHFANVAKCRQTILHGDYRSENMMFGRDNADDLAIIDWQTWGLGCGMFDVAYFLGTSVSAENRRCIERQAVETYHEIVCGLGTKNYTLDDCWHSYRQNMLGPLMYYVIGCGMADLSDTARLNTAKVSLTRLLTAIEDLDSGEFLPVREPVLSSVGAFSALSSLAYRTVSFGMGLGRRGQKAG
ncbi:MAG: phosphotransferase [Rhodospirillales bacterium]|nr:phosphotransferase [Rhodospirillales bacterium]MCY4002130.1 phosphotransferase [Rhodospirillales bacterium]